MLRLPRWILVLLLAAGPAGRVPHTARAEVAAKARPQLALQIGHTEWVKALAFSPDGKQLASGSADKTVKLWDAHAGTLPRTLAGHSGLVTALAFSPDGRRLASGSLDKTILLWDVGTGRLQRTMVGQAGVLGLAFSPDGKTLASSQNDKTLQLWDVATGLRGHTLQGSGRAAFSPGGSTLVCGGEQVVRSWDVRTGAQRRTVAAPLSDLAEISFLPGGATIATLDSVTAGGSADIIVRLWDAGTWRLRHTVRVPGGQLSAFVLAPDGRTLAGASEDNVVRLWDAQTGVLQRSLPRLTRGALSLAFAPDSRTLADGGGFQEHTPHLWDLASGKLKLSLTGQNQRVRAVAFSPDGNSFASGSADGTVRLWNAATGAVRSVLAGHRDIVTSVAFSPDGQTLASGSWDQTIKLWSVATGRLVRTLTDNRRLVLHVLDTRTNKVSTVVSQGATIEAVAWSPDGKTIAGASDGVVQLWSASNGRRLGECSTHGDEVTSVAFASDGSMVAAGTRNDRSVAAWRAGGSEPLPRELGGHTGWVTSVTFSPDGGKLVSGSLDNTVKLWDVRSGKLLHTLVGHTGFVESVAFSADGQVVASGSDDNTVRLWSAAAGTLRHTLVGHQDHVSSVAFAPDGKVLLSGSDDGTLKLWDTASGRLLATLLTIVEAAQEVQAIKARAIEIGDKAIEVGDKAIEPGDKGAGSADSEWFITTPEGYFDCSANAARFIKWDVDGALYPAERYLRRFRRPDLARQALRDEAITESPFTNEDVPPTAHFVSLRYDGGAGEHAADGSSAGQSRVTVTVETWSRHPVRGEDVLVLVNGRPLPPEAARPVEAPTSGVTAPSTVAPASAGAGSIEVGDKPITIGDKAIELGDKAIVIGDKPIELGDKPGPDTGPPPPAPPGVARRFTFRVPLPRGAAEVRMRTIAFDSSGLGSNWAEMIPLTRPGVRLVPGRLYALCVGLSHYRNGQEAANGGQLSPGRFRNLKFAARDASDMAARLQREGRPLYEAVQVHSLTDEQATVGNLRAGLHWLQQSVRPGQVDTALVFLSGHGVSDAQGRYYFPAYEFDPRDAANTSLSGQELRQELGGRLPARSVFLFVDSCHSGALAGARSDDLNFEVNTSGVNMMASSSSAQSSYEYEGWQHGAFTLALLKSLARPELARQGSIRFNGLTYAVPAEIARLLAAAQQSPTAEEPVVPLEGRRLDDPVAQPLPWKAGS